MKMTEMSSYMIENPKFEPYKPKKRRYHSSSMLSIFLSIFTYIMIFYVFEVSPSSVFKDTKVLFFISNAIILIIAADYGAFTDKESHDFYGEYTTAAATMRSRVYHYSPITVQENLRDVEIKNPKDVETKNPIEEEEKEPIVKEIICVSPPEHIVRVVNEEKPRDDVAIENYKPVTDPTDAIEETSDARNHVNPKAYGRSKSDKPRRKRNSEGRDIKRKSYGRRKSDSSTWMVAPEKWENVEEESEEFSKMSNEELNKRVEDFIQRFNKQIRSQSQVSST